jgi:primosomal protein N'
LDGLLGEWKGLVLAGPGPAPLLKAESFFRYQIMIRCRKISQLSRLLSAYQQKLSLPEDLTLTIDIDPMNLL